MLLRVTWVDYTTEDDTLIVRVAGRGQDGKRHIYHVEDFEPYGFYPASEPVPNRSYIERIEEGYTSFDGVDLQKIVTTLPKHHKDKYLKGEFTESYESDVPFYRRCSIDGLAGYIEAPASRTRVSVNDLDLNPDMSNYDPIEPRVMIGDIEVLPDMSMSFEEMKDMASQPIINITLWDSYEDEYCAIVLDEYGDFEGGDVRGYLESHWEDCESSDLDISLYQDCDIRLRKCSDEQALLESFIDYVREKRPDVISGWNWVDFDHEYLLNRLNQFHDVNRHRLSDVGSVGGWQTERVIDGLPGFDMMDAYCDKMTFHDWRSSSLDYVSNYELGIGKVEDISIGQEYQTNPERLLAYNIIDVQLCVALDRYADVHNFFYQLADRSSVQIYDTFSEMRLVDGLLMSLRADDEVLPRAKEKSLDANAGGLVLEPADGISEDVAVNDLKSLYPSAIITCNISTETLTKDPNEADITIPWMPEKEEDVGGRIEESDLRWNVHDGIGVSMNQEGLIPKYLTLLFKERDALKSKRDEYDPGDLRYDMYDRQQAAVKVVMNSFYGVMSNDYWRLSREEMGDAVTAAARFITWSGVQIAQELGFNVEYGDTDSVMISLRDDDESLSDDELLERGYDLAGRINDRMDDVAERFGIHDEHPFLVGKDMHGSDQHCLMWEFEKFYKRFFQAGTKKRYAGLLVWKEGKWLDEPKPDITGFETKRSDVPELTSEAQPEVIRMVLNGESFETVSDYIAGLVESIKGGEMEPRRFAMPGVINKPLEEYPNRETPRACEYGNDHLDANWAEGDEPWVVYVDSTPAGLPYTNVLALEWNGSIPDGFSFDYDAIIRKTLRKPLEPILNEARWPFNELVHGERTQAVADDLNKSDNPFATADDSSDEEDEGSAGTGALSW